MNYDDKQSPVFSRANEILNEHDVLLEKRLYLTLKKEFPDLNRNDFNAILNKLLKGDYVMQRGLIRRIPSHKAKTVRTGYSEKKQGKGASDASRLPEKRGI